jgi:hypothetical protein
MAILDEFDPKRDGWFFQNWGEDPTMPFTWDLYRKTYLAINPTNDPIEAPLDVAFYEIFKSCAQGGNCGGMTMLALAIYKYGGYFGFCSPAAFYTGGVNGPDRADVHQAINIMQARQFSTPGIRNFVDAVKAGQLNDGVAAFNRIQSGLASGDYCLLSLNDGPVSSNAHTIIPYRADDLGTGTRVLHVWDPNRPYDDFPSFYDNDLNTIVITGSTAWSYDQNAGGAFSGGHLYAGSQMGWFFAIPTSLLIHKSHQPISPGFVLTQLALLFIQGLGSAVTQVQDAEGRRLYRSDRARPMRGDLETDPDRRLTGVAPWPWMADAPGGPSPGDLFFLERPPGSSPLTVTVRGSGYRLVHASTGHLTELEATSTSAGRDRVLIAGSDTDDQVLEMRSDATGRRADIHHLRPEAGGDWRSVAVRNARVTRDGLRVHASAELDGVEVSSAARAHDVDLEFRQYRDRNLTRRRVAGHRIPSGRAVRLAPADWDRLSRTKIDQILV